MKTLNKKYKGTKWKTGNHPTEFIFDNLTQAHIPFLEKIGLGHLVIELCDQCEFEKCKCKKISKSKTKAPEPEDETE